MTNSKQIHRAGLNYSLLPDHIQDGMRLYIERGIEPGGFLMAVLQNDLKGAFSRADNINRAKLFEIVSFVYGEMPSMSQGSPEKVAAWIAHGGFSGFDRRFDSAA